MAINHLARQTKCHTQLAHFVFEEFTQRLEKLQTQLLWQATHVVVALDGDSFLAFGAT